MMQPSPRHPVCLIHQHLSISISSSTPFTFSASSASSASFTATATTPRRTAVGAATCSHRVTTAAPTAQCTFSSSSSSATTIAGSLDLADGRARDTEKIRLAGDLFAETSRFGHNAKAQLMMYDEVFERLVV